MNVSVEQLREVADSIEPEQSLFAEMLRCIADRRSSVIDQHPNAKLALVIADALNDGQRRHDLLSEHEDHVLLLEVAEAARDQVNFELDVNAERSDEGRLTVDAPRVPRVFHRGDVIPGDVQAVKTPSGKVFPHFPDNGGFGYPKDGYGFLPHDTGKGWADSELPLTEVLPAPRKWARAAEVPDGVRFEEYEKPGQGSWVREGDRYRYRASDGFTPGLHGESLW